MDRRVEKTQGLLHEALASLVRDKDYDSISVTEILERANVGRSTFYMHFRDKDELLASAIHDMLRSVQSKELPRSARSDERIVGFSLPIFEHIHRHRGNGEPRMGARGRAVLHAHLQRVLVTSIANDVRRHFQSARRPGPVVSADLLARHVASTFILVLDWWVESRSRLAPKDADSMFRALILPVLAVG
jgi:AcrR family transcriptional regulator